MANRYLLGFDVGSSSVKASLVNADSGKCVATAFFPEKEAPIMAVKAGWAEQDPQMWWDNAKLSLQKIMKEAGATGEEIKAIGISYQMHGLVCVDKNLKALRPSIIWCDSRAVPYGEKAFDAIPEDLDILLTHDAPTMPPHGIISAGGWKGTDAGNKVLAEAIRKKKPKYALYGHIHSSSHELSDEGGTKVACLSLIDERYEPAYPPLVLEIEGHKSAKDGEE